MPFWPFKRRKKLPLIDAEPETALASNDVSAYVPDVPEESNGLHLALDGDELLPDSSGLEHSGKLTEDSLRESTANPNELAKKNIAVVVPEGSAAATQESADLAEPAVHSDADERLQAPELPKQESDPSSGRTDDPVISTTESRKKIDPAKVLLTGTI